MNYWIVYNKNLLYFFIIILSYINKKKSKSISKNKYRLNGILNTVQCFVMNAFKRHSKYLKVIWIYLFERYYSNTLQECIQKIMKFNVSLREFYLEKLPPWQTVIGVLFCDHNAHYFISFYDKFCDGCKLFIYTFYCNS